MKKRLLYFLILFIFFIFLEIESEAIGIDVSGSWNLTISANDLIAGPCSGLKSDYESSADAITINVSDSEDEWRVYLRKVDQSWHGDFCLFIKRTSSDYGVSGGTDYQEITDSNRSFFYTSREENNVSGIKVQLKLSGVSINIPPGTYITTVYYTIIEYD